MFTLTVSSLTSFHRCQCVSAFLPLPTPSSLTVVSPSSEPPLRGNPSFYPPVPTQTKWTSPHTEAPLSAPSVFWNPSSPPWTCSFAASPSHPSLAAQDKAPPLAQHQGMLLVGTWVGPSQRAPPAQPCSRESTTTGTVVNWWTTDERWYSPLFFHRAFKCIHIRTDIWITSDKLLLPKNILNLIEEKTHFKKKTITSSSTANGNMEDFFTHSVEALDGISFSGQPPCVRSLCSRLDVDSCHSQLKSERTITELAFQ